MSVEKQQSIHQAFSGLARDLTHRSNVQVWAKAQAAVGRELTEEERWLAGVGLVEQLGDAESAARSVCCWRAAQQRTIRCGLVAVCIADMSPGSISLTLSVPLRSEGCAASPTTTTACSAWWTSCCSLVARRWQVWAAL